MNTRCYLFALPVLAASLPAHSSVVISEVLFDAIGSDSSAGTMFVELYGDPGEDLSGWSLIGINGSNGAQYLQIDLAGLIAADGIFVLADQYDTGLTNVAGADQVANFDFQNGPDSLQLWNDAVLVDSLAYGDFSATDFFAGEGLAAGSGSVGQSVARIFANVDTDDNQADFQVLDTPTPGFAPVSAVPVPAAAWLFGGGLAIMAGFARRN